MTVAEIARRAAVSEATVFNYFPSKEDLIYSRMQSFEASLLAAVRERHFDQSVLAAVRSYLLTRKGLLTEPDPAAQARLVALTRIVANSPALRARERQIYDEATQSLARLIAEEASFEAEAMEPWVIANALTGVHRALVGYVRRRLLADADTRTLARDVQTNTEKAFALLKQGLSRAYRS